MVSCVLVQRRPQSGIGRDGQEDPPPRPRERRSDPQQPDVVFNVLDHVEQSNEVERPGKRRRASFTGDDGERATSSRGGQVLETSFEAEGRVLARERGENVAVSAAELEDSCARGVFEASAHDIENASLAVIEPEVPIPQPPEDSVTDGREARLESGVAVHRR